MSEDYSASRLQLHDLLLKKKLDVAGGRFWTLDPQHLRFRHGESMAELKVPYHMGADDEACVEDAITGLVAKLMKRYEPASSAEGLKEAAAAPPMPQIGLLKDKTFRVDIFIADSLEKRLAIEILRSTPYIDTAVIAAWLGAEGHGRKLIKWVSELLEKTLKDEAKHGSPEKTSYLAMLAVINAVRKKKEKLKDFRVRGLSYEKIDLVVGMVLFATLKTVVKDTFDRLKAANAPWYSSQAELLLLSCIVPKSFLLIPSNLLSISLNPYFLNAETYNLLSPFIPEAEDGAPASEAALDAVEHIRTNHGVFNSIRHQYELVRFRTEALYCLMEFDCPGTEAQETLYELYYDDRLIRNLLNDQRLAANLTRALEEMKKFTLKDPYRAEVISSFQNFLTTYRKAPSLLGGFLRSSKKWAPEDVTPVVESYFAYRFDDHVDKYTGLMRGCLTDRRAEYNRQTIVEEYNRGRLYRFSNDDRPVLKTLEIEAEGQLFIDMKDFTRKTLKVKEIAMAEFMKEYFYRPILHAASRYGAGMGVAKDERGIVLTNLPGDAAIFSGGVSYLTALAKDIQHIIRRYRDHLMMKLPPRKDEEILEEVHKSFEARKLELKQKRAELNAAFDRNEQGVESKLVALGEEEHRLENTYRDEIEAAVKGELEAGLYISYGTKAEITVIEPRQGFSEEVKVAIGEKINEAARGTFRNHLVRARLEVLLETERQKRKNKALRYPFDVYIDRIFSIKMPPELENAFDKMCSNRKLSNAQAMSQIMSNEFLNDLKKIISGDSFTSLRVITTTTDIYNKGQAMSINALEAYMKETRGTKRYFKKSVNIGDLDESIREAFFFPVDPLEIWFDVENVKGVERVEGFCKAGEVIFKGFEANTPMIIYEILNTEGEFFKAILKYHFQTWSTEAARTDAEN